MSVVARRCSVRSPLDGCTVSHFPIMSIRQQNKQRATAEKIHQHLKPDALDKVEQQLIAVTNIANCSIDQKDFEARCMAAFPVKGQMKLLYAAA